MVKPKIDKGMKDAAKTILSRGEKALFAGIDVFSRVDEEGREMLTGEKSNLMKDLINEGRKVIRKKKRDVKLDGIKKSISSSFSKARDKVDEVYENSLVTDDSSSSASLDTDAQFEARLLATLKQLNYPTPEDFEKLVNLIEELSELIQKNAQAKN